MEPCKKFWKKCGVKIFLTFAQISSILTAPVLGFALTQQVAEQKTESQVLSMQKGANCEIASLLYLLPQRNRSANPYKERLAALYGFAD